MENACFSKIINLVKKANDENEMGIRTEGGRILVNLARTFQKHQVTHLAEWVVKNDGIVLLLQIVTGSCLLYQSQEAVAQKYPTFAIVQNEGLVALILFCSLYPPSKEILYSHGNLLLKTIEHLLQTSLEKGPTQEQEMV